MEDKEWIPQNLVPHQPALEKFKKNLPPPYRTSSFTALHQGGTEADPVFVAHSNSRFCTNIGKEHTHTNVYFCIWKQGAYQKCGMCKNFHSSLFPILCTLEDNFADIDDNLERKKICVT